MKIIKTNKESMESLVKGMDMVADIVKQTIGPKGRNVVFTDPYGMPTVTNDGVAISREIFSEDEIEQIGIDIIKQSSFRTNMQAGDGTTTSITLAQAIVKEGLNTKNPLETRRIINEDCAKITQELKKIAKPIKTFEEIKQVATISAESEIIGELIAEAYDKVGKDGQVTAQESEISGVRAEYTNGLEIDEGYIIPAMMNQDNGTAVIENPYILIVDTKLSNIKDVLPVTQLLSKEGIRQLVVVSDGMDGNMLPTIVANKFMRPTPQNPNAQPFEIIGIRLPAIRKQEIMEDIGLVTNGKVFGLTTGIFPKDAQLSDLGRCEKLIATEKKTSFVGGKGDVDERIKTLKEQRDASEINKDKYDERIAWLKGQVAVIKVGAPTESELRYLKLKIDDAICATKAALEEGVVQGGGIALKTMANTIELSDIMKKAIQAPYNQIQENAGETFKISENVIDPVKVTRLALENACSCAGIFLTTCASIATKRVIPK